MSCQAQGQPDTSNPCNVPVGNSHLIPSFCTAENNIGLQNHYCDLLSTGGEWSRFGLTDTACDYDPNNPGVYYQGDCQYENGRGLVCQRTRFTGNPAICCFQDLDCAGEDPNSNPALCYSDAQRQNTCDPKFRNTTTTACQGAVFDYCTGNLATDDPDSTAWYSRWIDPAGCSQAIYHNLYAGTTGGGTCGNNYPLIIPGICNLEPMDNYNASGYYWAQNLVTAAMEKFSRQGFVIGSSPGEIGFHGWQDLLYEQVCCPYPGLCQEGAVEACANRVPLRISYNPRATQWCGCHLRPEAYLEYSSKFNIPPQCTPTCNRPDAIPITGIDGRPKVCQQNVCVIDGVTVNLINSQVQGGVNFEQFCGSCAGGQCSCIVSNTTIDVENSTIGGNLIPISEKCGSLSCQQTNPSAIGPDTISVPCGVSGGYNPFVAYDDKSLLAKGSAKTWSWLWTVLIIAAVLLILFVLVYFLARRAPPTAKEESAIRRKAPEVSPGPIRNFEFPSATPTPVGVTVVNKKIHRQATPDLPANQELLPFS